MEQTLASVLNDVYKVGETYEFRVMLAGKNGLCELRDDTNGITIKHKFFGKAPKRWERVNCKITSLEGGNVKVEPQITTKEVKPKRIFSIKDLAAIGLDRRLTYQKILERAMASEVMSEANAMRLRGNNDWVIEAMRTLSRYLPTWLAEHKGRSGQRAVWLDSLRAMAIQLIENTSFLSQYTPEERSKRQHLISNFADNAYQLSHAAWLIAEGTDKKFVEDTLRSMKETGWLYHPERKMSILMSLLAMRNHYAHDYIHDIFAVIRSRHNDVHFMDAFGDALRIMLSMYINTTSKDLDRTDHAALREIIEAIALELLLTKDKNFEQWNLHRGRMYMYAAIIVDKPASVLVQKAMDLLSGRLDAKLEFGWVDLDNITVMAHGKLNKPFEREEVETAPSVYESEHATIRIDATGMGINSATESPNPVTAISYPILDDRQLNITLPSPTKTDADAKTPDLFARQAQWKEIANALTTTSEVKEPSRPVPNPDLPKVKRAAEVGDRVKVRITGQDEMNRFLFFASIVDKDIEGDGWFNKKEDVISYNCPNTLELFKFEGKDLLLPAVVTEKEEDGFLHFSFRDEVIDATKDVIDDIRAKEEDFKAFISSDKNVKGSYTAIAEYGFSMAVWPDRNTPDLHKGDMVKAKINYIKEGDNNKLFVNTNFVDTLPERPDEFQYAEDAFAGMMGYLANYETYNPEEWEPKKEKETAEEPTSEDQNDETVEYLNTQDVYELSQLFDTMSLINRRDMGLEFDMLGTAAVLAKMAGDKYNAEYIETKMALLVTLNKFAMLGALDSSDITPLERRCEVYVRLQDSDIIFKLNVLRTLSAMGRTEQTAALLTANSPEDRPRLRELRELVISYNLMLGKQLTQARRLVKEHIYQHLNLIVPDEEEGCIKVIEGHDYEFKSSMFYPSSNKMHPDPKKQKRELMEAVCAFLNSQDGGTLYIGVADKGKIVGLDNDFVYINEGYSEFDLRDVMDHFSLQFNQALSEWLANKQPILEGHPLDEFVRLEWQAENNTWYARVTVKSFPTMVRLADGSVYIRQQSSSKPILGGPKEIAKYEKERAKTKRANALK